MKKTKQLSATRAVRWLAPLLALGGLAAFRLPAADDNPVRVLAERVAAFYNSARPEKVYLHLDRPVYGTGETIWFNAYLVDALRHRPDSLSKVLYVELLSPQRQLVARRTLRVAPGGLANGDIELDDSLRAGTYLLRAYTNWMRNQGPNFFYQRQLQVWPAAPKEVDASGVTPAASRPGAALKTTAGKVDVQFFPEGGALVAGLPAVVGFKAQAATGRGATVNGQVLDAQNKPVGAAFKSQHLGMGRLSFTPAAGQRYHARVTLADGTAADYPLPAVQPSGYALHVVDSGDAFEVEARYVGATPPGPALLLTEVRGYIIGLAPRPLTSDGKPVSWHVLKSKYPNGIVHFTLFNAQSQPQAERLAFVQNGPAALRITLTADKAAYGVHDRVLMKAQVTDASGQPVTTRFSVAVAEQGAATLDATAENIASNLLLTSDLAGYVEAPGYYFGTPTPETTRALDDLLLTQGWRRFVWKDLLAGPAPVPQYNIEQALALTGVVTGMGHAPIPNSQLTFIESKPVKQFLTGTTDAQGRFSFVGFDGKDTAVVTLQGRRTGGGANVTVRPDLGAPTAGIPLPGLPNIATPTPAVADYLKRSRQQRVTERQNMPADDVRNVRLADIAVTGQRERSIIPANDTRRLIPGVVANTIINFADMPGAQSGIPIFSLLQGRVAGLTISGSPPNQSIQIRNSGTPQIILDGQRVEADVINSINSNDVEAVEVFKGTEAAIFGASGGVIAIYTKRANKNYKAPTGPGTANPSLVTVKLPGYYQTREFYRPRYGAPVLNAPESDPRRLTIYWNPSLQTDSKGEAEFTFYTADGSGNYQATAEGLTLTGEPGRGTGTIYVTPKR
ncbi:TonB-dependent receptor plug domain-containing protein [Hymenobacter bucti]